MTIAGDISKLNQGKSRRDDNSSNLNGIEPILIAEWPLKRGEIARVSIKNYKGTWLLDIRKFFENEAGEYTPTSKGIALSIKHLDRINAALADALTVARQHGLIPADQEGNQ